MMTSQGRPPPYQPEAPARGVPTEPSLARRVGIGAMPVPRRRASAALPGPRPASLPLSTERACEYADAKQGNFKIESLVTDEPTTGLAGGPG